MDTMTVLKSILDAEFEDVAAFAVFDPEGDALNAGWQTLQSLTGISNGGFLGVGPGSSKSKWWTPETHTDFIFTLFSEEFGLAQNLYIEYGVIILFIASFTPIPYQVFVIAAGFLSINFIMFVAVSIIGRGLRFFLVAYLADRYREDIVHYLNRYILQISAIVILLFVIYKLYN